MFKILLLLCVGLVSPPESGGPVCPFPPGGPGVCLYCPCPWDYYTPCDINEPDCNSDLGTRNGIIDIVDLLYLLAHWGEEVYDAGGCIPEPGYSTIGVRTLLDLLERWGTNCD